MDVRQRANLSKYVENSWVQIIKRQIYSQPFLKRDGFFDDTKLLKLKCF